MTDDLPRPFHDLVTIVAAIPTASRCWLGPFLDGYFGAEPSAYRREDVQIVHDELATDCLKDGGPTTAEILTTSPLDTAADVAALAEYVERLPDRYRETAMRPLLRLLGALARDEQNLFEASGAKPSVTTSEKAPPLDFESTLMGMGAAGAGGRR